MRIEVRPGEGGEDASVFADQIADALLRLARKSDPSAKAHGGIIDTDAES